MKFILDLLAAVSFGRIFGVVFDLVKGHLFRHYIHLVEHIRRLCLTGIATFLCLMIVTTGFIILHVALFFAISWDPTTRMILMFSLGGLYVLVPTIVMVHMHSRESWLTRSGVKKIIDDKTK